MSTSTINLFTYGDSLDINTWSNIPYYFQRALLAHGVRVNPVNIAPPDSLLLRQFSRVWGLRHRVASGLGVRLPSDVFRTKVNYRLTNNQIKVAAGQHGDADLNLFLTFSFSSYTHSTIPVVHYCDRTYEHHLEDLGQIPTRRDHAFIQVERDNLENAALVLTTSEVCRDFITTRYQVRRVAYLRAGLNVEAGEMNPDSLIAQKEAARDILFIGRGAHKRGVDILLTAFAMFNQRHDGQFALHIVGIRPQELPQDQQTRRPDVHFHGYLDRNIAGERALYNQLLRSARLFVFPMRPGPVAGVLREAQLNCTPVVISNVPGTAERVTHDVNGAIVDRLEPQAFARQMDALVSDRLRWRRLAYGAHAFVKDWTWSRTATNFLEVARSSGLMRDAR